MKRKNIPPKVQGEVIQVKISRFIPAKPWRVIRMIARVQDFPRFMANVLQVNVIEKSTHSAITQWHIDVDGLPIQWKEKDVFDYKNFSVRFNSIEGDLEHFQGEWLFQKHREGTEVTIDVTARLGIPIIEKVVADLLQEKLTKNFQMMLDAMEDRFITERYRNIHTGQPTRPTGFVVMGHPYNLNHLIRFFKFFKPDLRTITKEFLLKLFEMTPSYHSYDIPEFRSKTGKKTHGFFVLCPIIPDMIDASPERVFNKVVEGCQIGQRLGAGIVTLGGFTSIAGERFSDKLRSAIKIPLTTGNTYTAAMALEGIRRAAQWMGLEMAKASVTIIGGNGDIGSACARVLAREVKQVTITGRNKDSLRISKEKLKKEGNARVEASTDNNAAVKKADIVIAAASSAQSFVDIKNFRAGSIICDVGYPKNTSYMTAYRNDLFAFSGGFCQLPCNFELGFDIGVPAKDVLYGCFAEAIILSLEDRYENFSEGRGKITAEKIEEIKTMAEKHGFQLSPFYWGDKIMTEKEVSAIRDNVRNR